MTSAQPDPCAETQLTDEHRRSLLAWFGRLGLKHHDAEDCAQSTLLRVHAALPRYERRAPFGAFLRSVSRSVYADWCRRQRVRRPLQAPGGLASAAEVGAPQAADAWALLDLSAARASLPPELAPVVDLSVAQGLSYGQIAERLSIPVGTVKSRMFRAVRLLRRELHRDG